MDRVASKFRFTFHDGFVLTVTAYTREAAFVYVNMFVSAKHDGLISIEKVQSTRKHGGLI